MTRQLDSHGSLIFLHHVCKNPPPKPGPISNQATTSAQRRSNQWLLTTLSFARQSPQDITCCTLWGYYEIDLNATLDW